LSWVLREKSTQLNSWQKNKVLNSTHDKKIKYSTQLIVFTWGPDLAMHGDGSWVFEAALVNYVVPGSLPPTTHSGDASLMRFRASTWRFRDVFVHRAERYPCDDHVATFLVVTHPVFEAALVNYVVPGSLPPTTHSGDAALMRFRAFTWRFRASNSHWKVALRRPRCDILDGDVCTVRRRASQLRRAWLIAAKHAFRRRHASPEAFGLKSSFTSHSCWMGNVCLI
jgi:hypothetical protein